MSATWDDLPASTRTCGYVKRTAAECDRPAAFVLDVGFTGVGACVEHLGRQVAFHFDGGNVSVSVLHRDVAAERILEDPNR